MGPASVGPVRPGSLAHYALGIAATGRSPEASGLRTQLLLEFRSWAWWKSKAKSVSALWSIPIKIKGTRKKWILLKLTQRWRKLFLLWLKLLKVRSGTQWLAGTCDAARISPSLPSAVGWAYLPSWLPLSAYYSFKGLLTTLCSQFGEHPSVRLSGCIRGHFQGPVILHGLHGLCHIGNCRLWRNH